MHLFLPCYHLSHLLFLLSAHGIYTKAYAESTATTRAQDLHLFLNHALAAEINLRQAEAAGARAKKRPEWLQGVRGQLETVTTVTKVLYSSSVRGKWNCRVAEGNMVSLGAFVGFV